MNKKKPNILFFMVDQLSAKWIEPPYCHAVATPNFLRLQKRGVSFSRAISSNPVCCPARATLATGLSSRSHGLLQNGYELDPTIPTFMRSLQQAGWKTGAFGKIHLHPQFAGLTPEYRQYGFDEVFCTEDPRAGQWLDWIAQEHPEYYNAALSTFPKLRIPELHKYGKEQTDLVVQVENARRNDPSLPQAGDYYYTLPFPEEISQTAWITKNALNFLAGAGDDTPVYMHVSYVQPHRPFCPPQRFLDRIREEDILPPIPAEWLHDPEIATCFQNSPECVVDKNSGAFPEDWKQCRKHYLADIAFLDHQLGIILDELSASNLLDNTYIILLSDHGEMLMDHGFVGKHSRHYDASVRIPLMLFGPGLQRGQVCEELVQLEDIFPTVLDMAGLPLPTLPVKKVFQDQTPTALPGQSLLGFCRGERSKSWRDAAFIESYNNIFSCGSEEWARSIRTKDWRYTMYPAEKAEHLFHLANDPNETRNLAYDPRYANKRQELRDQLMDMMILQNHPHPPRGLYAADVF